MIEGTIAVLALFILIGLFIFKMYNVMVHGELYDWRGIFITYSVALIAWLLFFMSLSATVISEETITTPGAETYTVEGNDYATFAMYTGVANILLGFTTLFTVIEVLFLFGATGVIRKPLKARDNRGRIR